MADKTFFASPEGRLVATTSALALAGGGVMAFAPTFLGAGTLPILLMLAAVGCIVSVGVGIEPYPAASVYMLLSLLVIGGCFFAVLRTMSGGSSMATISFVLAAICAFTALTGKVPWPRRSR